MFSYLFIWLFSFLFLFPNGNRIESKSLYALIFSTFSLAQALLGFISLLFIVFGISKFPIFIFALITLIISILKFENSKKKLTTLVNFLIKETKSFFIYKNKTFFQKTLPYISIVFLILIFISSIGPINHPDAADYHVGYPFQYFLRGKFFIDGGLHQGLLGIADYANLAFIQENCIWLIRVVQIINLPILVLFLSKNFKNKIYIIAFLTIPTIIQWSTIGKPLFLGESSLIITYLIWKESKSKLTLKLLTISILNCIGFKISSLIIIFPIFAEIIIYFFNNKNFKNDKYQYITQIFFSKQFLLSSLIILCLLSSRYAITGNFAFPLFTNIFNSNDHLILKFSEMLKKYRRDDFFYLNIFLPLNISDLGQSIGPFTLLIFVSYFYKFINSFKFRLKANYIFLIIISQLSLLLLFCQGRPDYYLSPLILVFYEAGKVDIISKKSLMNYISYCFLIFQIGIISMFLIISIFLNLNTAIAYEKNMEISAYGFSNSLLIDEKMKGKILFNSRNTRLYYPINYLDKDKMNRCIIKNEIYGLNKANEICLRKFNVTQIVNAPNDLINNEEKYNCQKVKTIRATRNILRRKESIISYCKQKY